MFTVNFLGDSITRGEKASREEFSFVSLVGKRLNIKVNNYGISGTRFAKQIVPSINPLYDKYFASRVDDMDINADLVIVFGGTNDFGHGDAPIGKLGDKTVDTFYGAVDYTVNKLLNRYKKEQIVFILPIYRLDEIEPTKHQKPFKHTMEEYRQDMLMVLKQYDIEVLDIKDAFGKAENSPLYFDHVHPNDEGHKVLADLISSYIEKRMNLNYRLASLEDIDEVMTIIEDGRAFLSTQNSGQWQDGYPNRDTLLNDIKQGNLYVVLKDKDIAGVCALTYHEDDYDHLYEGKWLTDYPYMVMHRIAVKKEYRSLGYGKKLFEVFIDVTSKKGYHSLRIDTHENNIRMRKLMDDYGFVYCGKAILTPNKDRMVFEKVI